MTRCCQHGCKHGERLVAAGLRRELGDVRLGEYALPRFARLGAQHVDAESCLRSAGCADTEGVLGATQEHRAGEAHGSKEAK